MNGQMTRSKSRRIVGAALCVTCFVWSGCTSSPRKQPLSAEDASAQSACHTAASRPTAVDIERITTITPFPRGLVMHEGSLYVLCRGRVRGAGGVSAAVNDQAGTIYRVSPNVTEPITSPTVGEAVRENGEVFAMPTDPPFQLWDRRAMPPDADRRTDRPYCTLRFHEPTKSFYLCAFSGIDKPKQAGQVSFSKNLNDGLLRYDLRTRKWYEVERHAQAAGGNYPNHDPQFNPPPHGWLNGPDNCLVVGNWLYAVSKDNNLLVRYDLRPLIDDPEAGCPPSEVVLGEDVPMAGGGMQRFYGHSALAAHDGWLYVACRTSSVFFRVPLTAGGEVVKPVVGELVARFEPYDPQTHKSANVTDIDIDSHGRMYVVSAKPSRIYRFVPDPQHVFDGRREAPWTDLAALTHNPKMKSENVLVDGAYLYITSGDGYAYQQGAAGTVYRVAIAD